MPPKRKAVANSVQEPETKRRTRSNGGLPVPLALTQTDSSTNKTSPTKARKLNATHTSLIAVNPQATPSRVVRTYGRSQRKLPARGEHSGSLKENAQVSEQAGTSTTRVEAEKEDEESEDELMLSPNKSGPDSPRTTTPPRFMAPVEVGASTTTKDKQYTGRPSRTQSNAVEDSDSSELSSPPPLTKRKRENARPSQLSTSARQTTVHVLIQASPVSPTKSTRAKTSLPTTQLSLPIPQHSSPPATPHKSPVKKVSTPHASPSRLPRVLPTHLHRCLNAQKRSILKALHVPPDIHPTDTDGQDSGDDDDNELPTNHLAAQQLDALLEGTVTRNEGNSCLLIGPRGSGKTHVLESCLSKLQEKPIIIRLSGYAQCNDRLAMREIAYQLGQHTGNSFLSNHDDPDGDDGDEDEEVNPFLDQSTESVPMTAGAKLPPSSHLPVLISILPTLSRPTVVVLDAFDLFALHPRQSVLYCLLDTAQGCRGGAGSKGIAVVGVTCRVDALNMLEKRVKSRFSGRMLRTAPPRRLEEWEKLVQATLCTEPDGIQDEELGEEWKALWEAGVERFCSNNAMRTVLNETFSVTRDVRMLSRMLTLPVLRLSPTAPFLDVAHLTAAAALQRSRPQFPNLHELPYPSICLLIASIHADTAGHSVFTFEMLHEYFRDQLRASTSAPVQVNGGSIGMNRCSRPVLMSAYENLIATRIFVCAAPPSLSIAKEFVKHRSILHREDVKKAVEKMGQINLKKWLNRAQ